MKVLVVHGSKHGATAEIADLITKTLRKAGLRVEHAPANTIRDVSGYDAFVVGGSLYVNRWHHSAAHFVTTHRAGLTDKPVWFFSSGPLDDSANTDEIPPVAKVAELMESVGAKEHKTFGGVLEADRRGLMAGALRKKGFEGDFRDEEAIVEWANQIATTLQSVNH